MAVVVPPIRRGVAAVLRAARGGKEPLPEVPARPWVARRFPITIDSNGPVESCWLLILELFEWPANADACREPIAREFRGADSCLADLRLTEKRWPRPDPGEITRRISLQYKELRAA